MLYISVCESERERLCPADKRAEHRCRVLTQDTDLMVACLDPTVNVSIRGRGELHHILVESPGRCK